MIFRLTILPILALLGLAQGIVAQPDFAHSQALSPNQTVQVEIKFGAQHLYRVYVEHGQLLDLEISSAAVLIDVAIPDEQGTAIQGNTLLKLPATGKVLFLPDQTGWQPIRVVRNGKKEHQGSYTLRVKVITHPASDEIAYAKAQRQEHKLWSLYYQETEQSLTQAIKQGEETLRIWRRLQDHFQAAKTLVQLGEIYKAKEQFPAALAAFQQALNYYEAENIPHKQAIILTDMGQIYASLSDYERAVAYYQKALPLWEQGDETTPLNMIGWNLLNLGHAYRAYGEWAQAIAYYQQAYQCYDKYLLTGSATEQARGFGIVAASLGSIYLSQGEKQKALSQLKQAVTYFKQGQNLENEFVMYGRIGDVYSSLGEYEQARTSYDQALRHYRATNGLNEATILNSYGNLYRLTEQYDDAQKKLQQSLTIRRQLGDRRGQAVTLTNLGAVYASQQQYQQALDSYSAAQELWKDIGDKFNQGVTLNYLGLAHYELKESATAREHFNQALALRRATNDREGEANTLYNLARLDYDAGNFTTAGELVSAAITLSEAVRATVAGDDLRASYLATVRDYYEFYVEVMMRLHEREPSAGHHAAAFQISEMSRARSLLDALADQRLNFRQGVLPSLLQQERDLQQRLNAKAEYQRTLQVKKASVDLRQAADQEIQSLVAQIKEVHREMKVGSPRYAELTQFSPLAVSEIQQSLLDENTMLLVYSLGKEHSYLWCISKNELTSYTLPQRTIIEAAARQVYECLSAHHESNDWQRLDEATSALSRMILAPLGSKLQQQRLLIVADGALQYVPFAALSEPGGKEFRVAGFASRGEHHALRYAKPETRNAKRETPNRQPLIVNHEIINLPSAMLLAALRQGSASQTEHKQIITVIADPVFDGTDARLANNKTGLFSKPKYDAPELTQALRDVGATNLPRLLFTRREAEAIISLVPAIQRTTALDFAAERQGFLQINLSEYRILHIATHGLLDSKHPELSGLVFSLVDKTGTPKDGFLRLHEIYNLRLNADLVVLSACQTGLGKEIRGEGLIGLTRGFMYAGASRVIASLWKVNDKATAELMKVFYHELLGAKKQSPAAALRAAQLTLWKQKRWAHPTYWAAFAIQGEWK